MENLTIGQIVVGLGAVTALWVFAERIIKAIDGILDKRLDPMKQDINMTLRMELSMLEHLQTGNHQEAMGQLKKEVQEYLLERGK